MWDQLVLFLVALSANTFSAFAGGGAGLLQLPILIFLGLPFSIALATHKVASVALGIGASVRYLREDRLEFKLSALMLACGIPGVLLGASLILQIPERIAEVSLGILTIALGLYSIWQPSLGQVHQAQRRDKKGYFIGGLVLFAIGVLNGSLTSGTGLFVTLWIIQWFGLDYRRAIAHTLILVGFFWNGSGAVTLGILGEIYWSWLPVLVFASVLGGYLGAHLAILKGNRWIKHLFELMTFLVGFKLIF